MKEKKKITILELTIFSMLGALMFVLKIAMEPFPNIHPLGMLTMAYTICYRKKALIPIYVYVFLNGLYAGFNMWWIPYLYLWTVLWGITMLLPKKMPDKVAIFVYPLVCALHGLSFGTLYAPAQALMFGYDLKKTLLWIAAGFPWDVIHAGGNLAMGILILPITKVLKRINSGIKISGIIILFCVIFSANNYQVKAELSQSDYIKSANGIWEPNEQLSNVSLPLFKNKLSQSFLFKKMPTSATLMFTGDLMCLAGQQFNAATSDGYDFYPSYKLVSPIFNLADFVCGNLETLLSESNPITKVQKNIDGAPQCNGPSVYLEALKKAGFDCVVTANNHCCDWGPIGIIETEINLDKYGFAHTGTSKNIEQNFVIFNVNGIKVAILSYTHLINQRGKMSSSEMSSMVSLYSKDQMVNDINEAKENGAEFIVVYCHWGSENTEDVRSYQKQDAHDIAEAGADLIIGSHPHCLQGKEILTTNDNREVICMYSMGNFVSSMVRDINNDTIILKLDLTKKTDNKVIIKNVDYIPCHVTSISGYSSFTIVPTKENYNGGIHNSTLSNAEARIRKIIDVF